MCRMIFAILLCSPFVGSLGWEVDSDDVANGTNNVCVDCSTFGYKCTTRVQGWSPFKQSSYDLTIVKKIKDVSEFDPSLADCVLDGYKITDDIETFICFWAPKLGCQAVSTFNFVNLQQMHSTICQACNKYCICEHKYRTGALNIRALSKYLALTVGLTIWQ